MKIHKYGRFGKYLTVAYWRTRIALTRSGHPFMQIQETVIIEISEAELAEMTANAPEVDTSDYIFVEGKR